MAVTGEAELIANLNKLEKTEEKKARKATRDGDYSMDVGYDKEKGWIAHFPNAGTSKQHPQHFIEKARAQSKKEILAKYIEDLKV